MLPENADLRDEIARGQSRADFRETTIKIKQRYEQIHYGKQPWNVTYSSTST